MNCFDGIRSLLSADRLRLRDVKQSQNIIANKTAKSILLDTRDAIASFVSPSAPAYLAA